MKASSYLVILEVFDKKAIHVISNDEFASLKEVELARLSKKTI